MNNGRLPFVPSIAQTTRARQVSQDGFTVIELIITAVVFLTLLATVGGLLVSSTRAYGVTAERSEALQDSEAVLQLIRYELSMAGYRGIEETTFDRPFTSGVTETLVINRLPAGDNLTLRYFEDRYISGSDTGERVVRFYVDGNAHALVREEERPSLPGGASTTELMVGNIVSMQVLDVVGRFREQVPVADVLSGEDPPEFIAGLNMLINFVDGSDWEFLVGVSNPQVFAAVTGP